MPNKEDLLDFEKDLVQRYLNKEIKSPIHLSGGNENQLIEIFKEIKPEDWVFTTYRSHYHALLKGVPKDWLLKWVLENKSIHLMNKEHKIVTSAMVGGTLPQAVGCAMAIKHKQKDTEKKLKEIVEPMHGNDWKVEGEVKVTPVNQSHVWAFCGDMAASTGVFSDCANYALSNKLPITFVVEDNGLSTDTPTHKTWNMDRDFLHPLKTRQNIVYYKYERIYPHYGIGKRIDFETGEDLKNEV